MRALHFYPILLAVLYTTIVYMPIQASDNGAPEIYDRKRSIVIYNDDMKTKESDPVSPQNLPPYLFISPPNAPKRKSVNTNSVAKNAIIAHQKELNSNMVFRDTGELTDKVTLNKFVGVLKENKKIAGIVLVIALDDIKENGGQRFYDFLQWLSRYFKNATYMALKRSTLFMLTNKEDIPSNETPITFIKKELNAYAITKGLDKNKKNIPQMREEIGAQIAIIKESNPFWAMLYEAVKEYGTSKKNMNKEKVLVFDSPYNVIQRLNVLAPLGIKNCLSIPKPPRPFKASGGGNSDKNQSQKQTTFDFSTLLNLPKTNNPPSLENTGPSEQVSPTHTAQNKKKSTPDRSSPVNTPTTNSPSLENTGPSEKEKTREKAVQPQKDPNLDRRALVGKKSRESIDNATPSLGTRWPTALRENKTIIAAIAFIVISLLGLGYAYKDELIRYLGMDKITSRKVTA